MTSDKSSEDRLDRQQWLELLQKCQSGHASCLFVVKKIEEQEAYWSKKCGELEYQSKMLTEALEKYADKMNWGYLDENGVSYDVGIAEDNCLIGPSVARNALSAMKSTN
jgi:hypothetical protein